MVADQDAPRQLSRIHDVDGTYYWRGLDVAQNVEKYLETESYMPFEKYAARNIIGEASWRQE